MSIASPIKGADSSDNNELNVKELAREGYKVLIQRRTGGIDIKNGKRVPYVDRCFDVTNRALRDTDMIPGDYAFPINPDFLDINSPITASTCTCGTPGTGVWMSGSTLGSTTSTPAGIPDGGDATRGCCPCVLNSA
jgi:hypothetical protein